jgi:hypothetical protein
MIHRHASRSFQAPQLPHGILVQLRTTVQMSFQAGRSAMAITVLRVLDRRRPAKILDGIVCGIAVIMRNQMSCGWPRAQERFRDQRVGARMAKPATAAQRQRYNPITLAIGSQCQDAALPSTAITKNPIDRADTPKAGGFVSGVVRDGAPLFMTRSGMLRHFVVPSMT